MLNSHSDPTSPRTRSNGDVDRTERGSVWDVPVDWRNNFWVIFSLLMLAAAAFETWFDFEYGTAPTPLHRFRAIIWSTVQYMAPAAPIAIFLTEGIRVLSEKYLRKRFRDGLNEGVQIGREQNRKEGREEGRGEGRVEGVHIGAQAILDWLKRRDAAIAAGVPFDEPPPDPAKIASQTNGSGNGATPQPAANGNGNGNGTQPRHFADLESWYIRKGIAEDMGRPFNEPHPFNGATKRNGNGSV